MADKYEWVVRIKVDPVWVADGFNLTDDRMQRIMEHAMPYAYSHEIECEVLESPTDESIAAEQGYKTVEAFRESR